MKNTKRRLEILSFYDATGIVAHLEKMAQKGWALERIRNNVWRYRRIQPKELRYAVVYLPSSSEFDPGPTEANRELQEFCAQAGWVQVASLAQMHIFCNEAADPVPIETEPQVQLDTLHRAMKKNFLPSQIVLLVLGIFQLAMQVWMYRQDPLDYLSSSSKLVGFICGTLVTALSVNDITKYYRWRKKAILAAKDGEFLPTSGSQKFQYFCLAVLGVAMVGWILSLVDGQQKFAVLLSFALLGLVYAAAFGMKALMKKLGVAAGIARILVFAVILAASFAYAGGLVYFASKSVENHWFEEDVEIYEWGGLEWNVYHDELPLYVEDLMETDYDRYSTQLEKQGTFLLTVTHATQTARYGEWDNADLQYVIYDIHFPALKDLVWNELYWYDMTIDESQPMELHWLDLDAEGVNIFQLYGGGYDWNVYYLRYDSRIVKLSPDWLMTDEQLLTATRILAPQ